MLWYKLYKCKWSIWYTYGSASYRESFFQCRRCEFINFDRRLSSL